MKTTLALHAVVLAGLATAATSLVIPVDAGHNRRGPSIGPDVVASRIGLDSDTSADDFNYYGTANGIRAFSIASTSCNIGDVPAEWQDGVGGRNPLMAQNLYRLKDGRFEQIGMSWLKHTWCALSEPTCNHSEPCSGTGCHSLGVGCADTYWADLNGTQFRLGPRWEVNPQGQGPGGVHDDTYLEATGPAAIRGRLQVADDDILAGGRFFAEIHYVTHDESLERRFNNASYREVNVSLTGMSGVGSGQASVAQGEPAIYAWAAVDPTVTIVPFEDVPGEGRFHLGYKVTDNGDGTWTYEYALHNLNSDRAAGSVTFPLPSGVNVSSTGFNDIHYHGGDGINYNTFDGTDWLVTEGGNELNWSTDAFSRDANANALRWSTLYNFRFTADLPPGEGPIEIGLFKPGTPDAVTVTAAVPVDSGPVCTADLTNGDNSGTDGVVNIFDLLELLNHWGADGPGAEIAPPNSTVDVNDLLGLLSAWGDCP